MIIRWSCLMDIEVAANAYPIFNDVESVSLFRVTSGGLLNNRMRMTLGQVCAHMSPDPTVKPCFKLGILCVNDSSMLKIDPYFEGHRSIEVVIPNSVHEIKSAIEREMGHGDRIYLPAQLPEYIWDMIHEWANNTAGLE